MTDDSAVHVLVFDGFADWEPAHALAELRRWGQRDVRSVGFTREVVTSMGLRVLPDCELAPVDFARAIFAELSIFSSADEALWFDMFKQGRLPQPL